MPAATKAGRPPVDGERVKSFREKAGLTREALAVKAGVSFMTIGKIEREDTDTTATTLVALANALGVRPEELLR